MTALPNVPNNCNPDYHLKVKENNVVDSLWIQQPYSNGNNSMGMQSQLSNSQHLSVQQERAQDYDEIYPFFDTIDDRQSYMDSKEVYESRYSNYSIFFQFIARKIDL